MNSESHEHRSLAGLDQLLDELPVGAAPVTAVLTAGRAVRARRGRRWAGAGLAVVGVLALSGTAFLGSPSDSDRDRDSAQFADDPGQVDANRLPGLGDDTRRVGIGRVVIDVPSSWRTDEAVDRCHVTRSGTVFFPARLFCPSSAPELSSVAIRPDGVSADELFGFLQTFRVDGFNVTTTEVACDEDQTCVETFGIDALGAWFTVTAEAEDGGRELVDLVRDSLTILPETSVVVPPVTTQTRAAATNLLRTAGLHVKLNDVSCPANASCLTGVVDASPGTGTVVERGSTITLTVLR